MTAIKTEDIVAGVDAGGDPVHRIVGNTTGALLRLRQQGSGNAIEVSDGSNTLFAVGAAGAAFPNDPLIPAMGLKSWTYNPNAITGNSALTSQTLYALALPTIKGQTYTGIQLACQTAAVGTAPTGFYVGLSTFAANGSLGTMLAQSANLGGNAALLAQGFQQLPFSAPYVETATGVRYALLLQNGAFSVTQPTFYKTTASIVTLTTQLTFCATAGAAVAAPAANASPLANNYSGSNTLSFWVALY